MPPVMGGPFGRHAAMWLFHLLGDSFPLPEGINRVVHIETHSVNWYKLCLLVQYKAIIHLKKVKFYENDDGNTRWQYTTYNTFISRQNKLNLHSYKMKRGRSQSDGISSVYYEKNLSSFFFLTYLEMIQK